MKEMGKGAVSYGVGSAHRTREKKHTKSHQW